MPVDPDHPEDFLRLLASLDPDARQQFKLRFLQWSLKLQERLFQETGNVLCVWRALSTDTSSGASANA